MATVARRLGIAPGRSRVVTVGGTNGKGTCVAALSALLETGGWRVGAYTSPHLLHYAERVRVTGQPASEAALCAAFAAIDAARQEISLTYFEFGTLAALLLFQQADLDVWVLEVGLGGRLDAVNLVDADLAIVCSVGLDHCDWLGTDRESIAREKVAIARRGRPLLIGDPDPPAALAGREIGARPAYLGRDFHLHTGPASWRFEGSGPAIHFRPPPGLHPANLALALEAAARLGVLAAPVRMRQALEGLSLPGRCQHRWHGANLEILDVAHNTEAAQFLAGHLAGQGRFAAVFAARADKPVEAMTAVLAPHICAWHLLPLPGGDSAETAALANRVQGHPVHCHATMRAAREAAHRDAPRVVVWGSFLTVAMAAQLDG